MVEIFCFILTWRGLKSAKLEKMFFLPIYNKFVIQNNPPMQLGLIFHKPGNENKQESKKF